MSTSTARFTHLNPGFICENCQREVQPLKVGCRNHCPFCLHSKHVDRFPGDRDNPCQGLMEPIAYEFNGKKGLTLVFKCKECGGMGKNKAAHEDEVQADSYELILKLNKPKS
ncbi:MAG: RNHCP domain-containing protein [Oligoflexales bacterium]|nr:RNHCP domain-containing protein [Oligoflexales bacterium]